jgi:hypothetical protein
MTTDFDFGIAPTILHGLRPDRGPYRPGRPDAPPSCPACGAPLELGPARPSEPDRLGLGGVCPAPCCGEVVTFRRLEGRLIVAKRTRRA